MLSVAAFLELDFRSLVAHVLNFEKTALWAHYPNIHLCGSYSVASSLPPNDFGIHDWHIGHLDQNDTLGLA